MKSQANKSQAKLVFGSEKTRSTIAYFTDY